MISSLSVVFMVITLIISLGVPVALIIWVTRKYRTGFAPIAVGFLIFFVTQTVIRLPIIQVLSLLPGVQEFVQNNYVLYVVILSITAGIFEEFGRLFGFGVMLKRKRELRHGVAYGIGHGGIESVLLVTLTYVTNLIFVAMINSGGMESMTAMMPGAGAAQLEAATASLVNTSAFMFLMSGLERIFAIAFHIAMSVLVLYGVRKKNIGCTLLAVLAHALVNFGAVMLGQYVHPLAGEAFMLVVAVAAIIFVLKMRKPFAELDPPPSAAQAAM